MPNGTIGSFDYDWGFDTTSTGTSTDYTAASWVKVNCTGTASYEWYVPFNVTVYTGNDEYQRGVTPPRKIKPRRKVSRRGVKRL
jgi:hypothetical protein